MTLIRPAQMPETQKRDLETDLPEVDELASTSMPEGFIPPPINWLPVGQPLPFEDKVTAYRRLMAKSEDV